MSGTARTAGTASFTAQVIDNFGAAATKALSITINSNLTVTTTSPMPSGAVNQPYSQALAAAGGFGAYAWILTGGVLPGGLSLAAGSIADIPAASGIFTFAVQVTDAGGNTAGGTLTITINAGGPVITTSSPLPDGLIGTAYSHALTNTNGTTPFTWSITSGILPAGLSLAASTGVISGIPTTGATSTFTVTVSDNGGLSDSKDLALTINTGHTSAPALSGAAAVTNRVVVH
jgi:hypothetical protein